MRLYFDTSVLGALTDPGVERPTVVARQLLRAVLGGVHIAVISNIVQEERERAPAEIRRAILHDVREIEFELVTEGVESGRSQDAAGRPFRRRFEREATGGMGVGVAQVDPRDSRVAVP